MDNGFPFPYRQSIRLKRYDYTQPGAYFVTLVTANRDCLFGKITRDQIDRSPCGKMVAGDWNRLPARFSFITLDEWVVMPNHLHGIIILSKPAGDPLTRERFGAPVPGSIPTLIRSFKSTTTKRWQAMSSNPSPLWQRNYYEHVIRNDEELQRIRKYIQDNPHHWQEDKEFR